MGRYICFVIIQACNISVEEEGLTSDPYLRQSSCGGGVRLCCWWHELHSLVWNVKPFVGFAVSYGALPHLLGIKLCKNAAPLQGAISRLLQLQSAHKCSQQCSRICNGVHAPHTLSTVKLSKTQ